MERVDEYGGRLAEVVHAPRVHEIRGSRVMVDADLAPVFRLPVRELRRQASRVRARFRDGWLLTLTAAEKRALGIRPRDRAVAVTEQGLVALSMALRTERAAEWSVAIVRRLFEMAEHDFGVGGFDLVLGIFREPFGREPAD